MKSNTDFFNSKVIESSARVSGTKQNKGARLDRNESPYDIDEEIKKNAIDLLLNTEWNRYPAVEYPDIYQFLSQITNIPSSNIATGPGAAYIITSFLNYCGLNNKHIIIPSPSFSLYEYHCKTYNIPYELWHLNEEFEYDFDKLGDVPDNAVIIIASPNNPVGNIVNRDQLSSFLDNHPFIMVLIDEVYGEFSGCSLIDLALKYSNLIVVKSFSKTFSAAGVRLGYAICNEKIADTLKKLILSFTLNAFTVAFIKALSNSPNFTEFNHQRIVKINTERDKVYNFLNEYNTSKSAPVFKILKPFGNFITILFDSEHEFKKAYEWLLSNNINVLDTSKTTKMPHSIRITIGTAQENAELMNFMEQIAVIEKV